MSLSTSQQKALVSLLEDGDIGTVNLIKRELILSGSERLDLYQSLLHQANGSVRADLRDVIHQIESAETLGSISRSLARLRTYSQLEELCWTLARAEQPGFEGGPYRRQLDHWAEELRSQVSPDMSSQEIVRRLASYLTCDQHLTGNGTDYYHPRNCHLPWVIEFRTGLPITLTLIYILIGQRLEIPIQGIGAPGHFLARLGDTIFDPYYGGRILTDGEWDRVRAEIPSSQRSTLIRATSPLQVMHRILLNLRNSHVKRSHIEGRRQIDHYLAVLQR